MEKKIKNIFARNRGDKEDNVISLRQDVEMEGEIRQSAQSRRLADDLSFLDPFLKNVDFVEESSSHSEYLGLQSELNGLMNKFRDRSHRLEAAIEKQNLLVRALEESQEQARRLEERLAENQNKTKSMETDFTRQFRLLEEENQRNKSKAESLAAELHEVRQKFEVRARRFSELKEKFEQLKSGSAEDRQRLIEEHQRSLVVIKEEVKQLVAALNAQKEKFDQFHQRVGVKHREMYGKYNSLQHLLKQKNRRVEELEAYREAEKQEFHKAVRGLKEQLSESGRQLDESRKQVGQNTLAYENEKEKTARLEADLKAWEAKSRQQEAHIETLREELSGHRKLRENYEAAGREIAAKEKELAAFSKQFETLREKAYYLQTEKSRLEADLKRSDETRMSGARELVEKRQIVEELKASLGEKQSQFLSLRQNIEALEQSLEEKTRSEADLKRELKGEKVKGDEIAIRLEKVRKDNQSLQQNLCKKEETIFHLQDVCRENQNRLSTLNEHCEDLEEALRSARDGLSGYQLGSTADRQRISALESELERVTSSWRKSHRQLKHKKHEIQKLRDQVAAVGTNHSSNKDEELQRRAGLLLERERQLDNYSKNLDQEKNRLRKLAVTLAREIESSQKLNPLKNYLDITEREISNFEVRLIRLPASAPERSVLEGEFEKLIQQRDFLRRLSESSATEVQKNVRRLMRFAQADELVPIPPVPPGKPEN